MLHTLIKFRYPLKFLWLQYTHAVIPPCNVAVTRLFPNGSFWITVASVFGREGASFMRTGFSNHVPLNYTIFFEDLYTLRVKISMLITAEVGNLQIFSRSVFSTAKE